MATNDESMDSYVKDVIIKGGEGSKLLRALTAPTLLGKEFVEMKAYGPKKIPVLFIPPGYNVVVHSSGGERKIMDLEAYTASMVENLVSQARQIGAHPLALANVVDSQTGDLEMLTKIGDTMRYAADIYRIAILNGENAIVGPRINGEANLTGTMVSIVNDISPGYLRVGKDRYAIFNPKGQRVFMNSDGVGTKTEFYERFLAWIRGLNDLAAMQADDTMKLGAIARVLSSVVEMRHAGLFHRVPFRSLEAEAKKIGRSMDAMFTLQPEVVGNRILGYKEGVPSYNMSGSVVSTIDDKMFENPLTPKEGMSLIAFRKTENPRANGISSLRKGMVEYLGQDWHKTAEGKEMGRYLCAPSTVLYPAFRELVSQDIAGALFHMSGGAFDEKLAKPLAEHDLYVELTNLFKPHEVVKKLMEAMKTSAEAAYGKWPMSNDGFVATYNPRAAIEMLKARGFEAVEVGTLQKAQDGATGVRLTAFNNEKIYFSGKEKK